MYFGLSITFLHSIASMLSRPILFALKTIHVNFFAISFFSSIFSILCISIAKQKHHTKTSRTNIEAKTVVFHCLSCVRKSLLLALAVHVIPCISFTYSFLILMTSLRLRISFTICFWFYANQKVVLLSLYLIDYCECAVQMLYGCCCFFLFTFFFALNNGMALPKTKTE